MADVTENTAATKTRTAVVVIHGMGEQKPMDTLRNFVKQVWQLDGSLFTGLDKPRNFNLNDTWTEPDEFGDTMELRRIVTHHARSLSSCGQEGVRVDFFELYWADLTVGTTWGDFLRWFIVLLCRKPPNRLIVLWCLLWLLTVFVVLSLATTAVMKAFGWPVPALLSIVAGLLAFAGGVKIFLSNYFGDVARYVVAAPRNIEVRKAARERGLKLISELSNSNKYSRIVLVGHSLGSILAHDLVWFAWHQMARAMTFTKSDSLYDAVCQYENTADALLAAAGYTRMDRPSVTLDSECLPPGPKSKELPNKFRDHRRQQRKLFRELSKQKGDNGSNSGATNKNRWLISDIITLGSPLTHAEFLLARNRRELCSMRMSREILRCPPILDDEEKPDEYRCSYHDEDGFGNSDNWKFHHASAMGPVRWTNICDQAGPVLFFQGDVISGLLAPSFGPGVLDIKVEIKRSHWLFLKRFFTHTLYWTASPTNTDATVSDHVQVLRDAINALDDDSVEERLLRRYEA